MKIGSKVSVICFFNTYEGEIIGESEQDNKSVWIVLIHWTKRKKLEIDLPPSQSKFFKDSLQNISNIYSIDVTRIEEIKEYD